MKKTGLSKHAAQLRVVQGGMHAQTIDQAFDADRFLRRAGRNARSRAGIGRRRRRSRQP
jgi:hypothetical protein